MTMPFNTNPYSMLFQQTAQTPERLKRIKGLEGAKSFSMVPNSEVVLFEEDDDVMYVKTTDANNFPTLRKFRFTEEPLEVPNSTQYVTIEMFNQFKEELLNAKQSVSDDATSTDKRQPNAEQHSANKKFNEYSKKQ